MALEDTTKITIVSSRDQVNAHLKAGWKLLAVATGVDESGFPIHSYHLGWQSEAAPVYPL